MPKIAIIEDELAIAEMYQLKLKQEGFSVQIAENGQAGLVMCEQMKPDLILLDLMMPIMSGPQMLEKMRATDWGKDIPVIIITNLGQDQIAIDFKKLKVSAYIIKALYTPKQLLEEVKSTLSKTGNPPAVDYHPRTG